MTWYDPWLPPERWATAEYRTPAEIARLYGLPSGAAVLMRVNRWNRKHPDWVIRRYPGKIHLGDFQDIMRKDKHDNE